MSGRFPLSRVRRGLAVLALTAVASPAAAHDVDVTSVARLFLDQLGPARYAVSVVDAGAPRIPSVRDVIPARCTELPASETTTLRVNGFAFECASALDSDDVLRLPWTLAGAVVIVRWSDGTEASAYFRRSGGVIPVRLADLQAGPASIGRLGMTYVTLGAEHILFGIDHLLFVWGIVLLVTGMGSLVKTITAFTVAHSMTLAMAVLGFVPIDQGPVEAAIALSIVVLAREVVARGDRSDERLIQRSPWIVAFAFGLLHGLGFAGALGEIGLPRPDIPLALLFFNVGVEVGQLVFVGGLLLAGVAVRIALRRGVPSRPVPDLRPALGYGLGAIAMFWFIERLPAVWLG